MTESKWLSSIDPRVMLQFLLRHNERERVSEQFFLTQFKVTDRKLRLFSCACCRQVWHLLMDERSRSAVEVGERYADNKASKEERRASLYALLNPGGDDDWEPQHRIVSHCVFDDGWQQWIPLCEELIAMRSLSQDVPAALLRDIFGNPFRPLRCAICSRCAGTGCELWGDSYRICQGCQGHKTISGIDYHWLYWRNGLIPTKAREIYVNQRFEDMPILADALEEAGCDNEEILRHCRGWHPCRWCLCPPLADVGTQNLSCGTENGCKGTRWLKSDAPHVRGCWVLDLLLDKK